MKTLSLIGFVFIISCGGTPKGLIKSSPVLELTSERKAEVIRDCVYNGWSEKMTGVSSYEKDGEFVVTQSTDTNGTVALVRIEKKEKPSIRLHHLLWSTDRWEKAINDCI